MANVPTVEEVKGWVRSRFNRENKEVIVHKIHDCCRIICSWSLCSPLRWFLDSLRLFTGHDQLPGRYGYVCCRDTYMAQLASLRFLQSSLWLRWGDRKVSRFAFAGRSLWPRPSRPGSDILAL